jgi:hypothetical protein
MQPLISIVVVVTMIGCTSSPKGGEFDISKEPPIPISVIPEELTISATDSPMPALVLPVLPMNGVDKQAVILFIPEGDNTKIIAADTPRAYATVEPMNIYKGTCGQLGGAVYALKGILDGHSSITLNISMDKIFGGDYVVNIHESVARIGNSIACAAIPLATETTTVGLHSRESDDFAGYAGLVAYGEITRIAIKLNSPTPGSQPSAVLMAGDCSGSGDEAGHRLSKLDNGLSITDIEVSLEELLSTEFSIVLSDENIIGQDFLACGKFKVSA